MKKFGKYLFTLLISCIILFIVGVILSMFLSGESMTEINVETLKAYSTDAIVLAVVGVGALIITIMFASSSMSGKKINLMQM